MRAPCNGITSRTQAVSGPVIASPRRGRGDLLVGLLRRASPSCNDEQVKCKP